MAKLIKLQLSGIRNFGPNEDDIQKITFYSPVTLFLGQNGSGKTTIIEALKFALSGEVPGGTKNGQGFVNDPKLNRASISKGQVRLLFSNAKGGKLTVSKSVQVTQKQNVMQFKRLDSTVVNDKGDGLSSRCSDIDTDICSEIGVSKSILNNVIFCHQEDSLWPLDEGKKLKEKFDEIFDATKYNKCIENMRKLHKKKTEEMKVRREQLNFSKDKKDQADKKRSQLQEKQEKLATLVNDIKKNEDLLQPVVRRLEEICQLENNLLSLKNKYTTKKSERSSLIEQQNSILKFIITEYEGSDNELKDEVASFESIREKNLDKIKALEKNKIHIQGLEENLSLSIKRHQVKVGQLKEEKRQYQDTISERNKLIRSSAGLLQITIPDNFDNHNEVTNVITSLKNSLQESKSVLDAYIAQFESEEADLQSVIDKCREKYVETKQTITSKSRQIDEMQRKGRDINSQLHELDVSDEQLKNILSKISRIDKDLQLCKDSFNADDVAKSIENYKQQIRELEESLEMLEKDYKLLQQNNITEAELENQRHEIVKREAEIRKLENKHFENFKLLFDETPTSGLKKSVESCLQLNTNKMNNITNKLNTKQREITTIETELRFHKKKLETSIKELDQSKQQTYSLCKGKPFDTVLNDIFQTIEKLQKNKGQYTSAKIMYEKFVEEFQSDKPCCPVCQTGFENKQGVVREIVATIRKKIEGIPGELRQIEEELKQKQDEHSRLLQLKPTNNKIENLTAEIPKQKEEIQVLESALKRVSNDITELKQELSVPQKNVDICNTVITDATLIDQYQLDISRSRTKIVELEFHLVEVSSNKSRQQVESEIEDKKDDLAQTRRNYESSQKKLNQHNIRCQELREGRSKLVEKQLHIQKAMQGKPQLQEQIVELGEKEELLKTEISELDSKLIVYKIELDEAINSKNIIKEANKNSLDEERNNFNTNGKLIEDVEKTERQVQAYIKKGIDELFDEAINELADCTSREKQFSEQRNKIVDSISKIKTDVANQETAFRNLSDNLALREKRKQQQELETEINNVHQQIGDHNYTTILNEKQILLARNNEIDSFIKTSKGGKSTLESVVRELEDELNHPEYKESYTNYKRKFFEVTVADVVAQDLRSYMEALEFSIMQFHKERMVQINRSIRELWSSIYTGNDIDYIQVKTEDCTSSGKRRAYNYKVVQIKNDVEIEMRGRCSAGQKVLACLVIRMALAETFSHNCGMLALDEPTTNLDRSNIRSLSEALARIINSHQGDNFQLLIITHDEEFLDTLRHVDTINYYWKVSRNRKGNSIIRRELL